MPFIFTFPDYLLLFIGMFNLIMAAFIFTNEPKNKVNIMFTLFALCLTLWSILLLVFRHTPLSLADEIMRAIYVSGILIAVSLWYFVHFFPKKSRFIFFHPLVIVVFTLIVCALLSIPGFIVGEAFLLPDGSRTVDLNPYGYYFFTIYFTFFYVGGLIAFLARFQLAGYLLKKQSFFLFLGMLIAVIFGGYFNIILPSPWFFNYHLIYWGPLFTLFIVLAVAYGVARLELMNIKALVTELFVIALILLLAIESIFITSSPQLILRLVILGNTILFGFLLIRSVLNEVKRREEVTQLAKSLEQANQRLQELDKQKTEFLSIASHQLRTPLSILKGYIELIHDGAYGRPTRKLLQTLADMDQSNERLIHLVDEFLNIARIEQGRTKYSFAATDLNGLLGSVVKELIERAAAKGLTIVWQPNTRVKEVYLDEDKIRHVVFNFIDNAIKYSERGAIRVTLEADKCEAIVKIKDHGVGFNAKKDGVNFFQKFYRGDNVKTLAVNGTGLGIFVCRKFIEAHFGRVWAVSRGLNKGSEFGFAIPLKQEGCSREVVESPLAAGAA